jgi:hypothetical protein
MEAQLNLVWNLMAIWARGRDVALAKAAAKVIRRLAEFGAEEGRRR